MRKKSFLLLLLVLSLVFAGCVSGTQQNTSSNQTVNYPPGVSSNGIDNLSKLQSSHMGMVSEGGYEQNSTVVTEVGDNKTTQVTQVMDDGDGNRYMKKKDFKNGEFTGVQKTWDGANETRLYLMITKITDRGNASKFGLGGPKAVKMANPSEKMFTDLDFQKIDSQNQTVESINIDGESGVEIQDSTDNITLTVQDNGLVRKYLKKDRARNQAVDWYIKITDVENLGEPGWIETARDQLNISAESTA